MGDPIQKCNLKDIPVNSDAREWYRQVLQHIYGDLSSNTQLSLENVQDYVDFELESVVTSSTQLPPREGRLGPERVVFCMHTSTGGMILDGDSLAVSSQTNFGSIKANCCVYSGRWQYEVMLCTKGVMQVGWATGSCKLSQQVGVGDTPNSYSFDASSVIKWNGLTSKYGKPWLAGDVIGCTIDLNKGKAHFYHNGCWLGEAFSNIMLGPGIAYFPTVSLVNTECVVANFGARPFRYPVEGFAPLQQEPHIDVIKAEKLLTWLERFLLFYDGSNDNTNSSLLRDQHGWMHPDNGIKSSMLLVATPLLHHLGPLLKSAYITEACLLHFLFKLCGIQPRDSSGPTLPDLNTIKRNSRVRILLDVFWTLMESSEVKECLENLIVSLLYGYRFSLSTADFYHERCHLFLVLLVLQHEKTCQFLLRNFLFFKMRIPMLMDIKPLSNAILKEVVPVIWYKTSCRAVQLSKNEEQQRASYIMSCNRLGDYVKQLTLIQDQIIFEVLRPPTVPSTTSCRSIVLPTFQELVTENSWGSRVLMMRNCTHFVTLTFFHRLVALVRNQIHVSCKPQIDGPNLVIPIEIFYNGTVSYHDSRRIGGLMPYLQRQYQKELKERLQLAKTGVDSGASPCHKDPLPNSMENSKTKLDDYKATVYLLDSIIMLYLTSAHSQLEKLSSLSESRREHIVALKVLDSRYVLCEDDSKDCLENTRNVIAQKLAEQARHLAWVSEVIYSKEARDDIHFLLQVTLRTLNQAFGSGLFYAFVPTFYIEACIKFCHSIKSFFSTAIPVDGLENWNDTLVQFGSFLVNNFSNPLIVDVSVKERLAEAFAVFVFNPSNIRVLENMPFSIHQTMIKGLLQPYENRAWVQLNWVLVRFWKGCGFAFRYTLPPDLRRKDRSKRVSKLHRPCPSPVFQKQIACWLWDNPDSASRFLSSVLSRINWTFSEFAGKLQDIHSTANGSGDVEVDSRQLKSCTACFEISFALLRVLEMVVNLQPGLVTNKDRPSAEILLTRLCQIICQVLNRVTSTAGCFQMIVNMNIRGLEAVHHFPILAAVAGIILSLTNNGSSGSRETAIKALISEPSYHSELVGFLLPKKVTSSTSAEQTFSFDNYSEVSNEEREQLEEVVNTLHLQHDQVQLEQAASVIDDESLCAICYANPVSATFLPCNHTSCSSCISLHLLNYQCCFFCKCSIASVTASNGEVIYPTAYAFK